MGFDDGIVGEKELSWNNIDIVEVLMHLCICSNLMCECSQLPLDQIVKRFDLMSTIFLFMLHIGEFEGIESGLL